jgi:multidrug efflux pump subunit AcrB
MVALKHFARLEGTTGPSAIHHFGGTRSVTISADTDDSIITSAELNTRLREKFGRSAARVPGLRMRLGGQEEEMGLSMNGLFFALVIACISIYFILVILFNSFLQPILIMSVIPFAAGGVFLTLVLHNRPLVFISLVGMLGLAGVVVNDAIVMVSSLNRKVKEEGHSIESIAEGALGRFRPVILTTLTTFAGLVPLAYGIGGDLPMIRPMVLVMAWGLVFATAVTLVFIPVLYSFVLVRNAEGADG